MREIARVVSVSCRPKKCDRERLTCGNIFQLEDITDAHDIVLPKPEVRVRLARVDLHDRRQGPLLAGHHEGERTVLDLEIALLLLQSAGQEIHLEERRKGFGEREVSASGSLAGKTKRTKRGDRPQPRASQSLTSIGPWLLFRKI